MGMTSFFCSRASCAPLSRCEGAGCSQTRPGRRRISPRSPASVLRSCGALARILPEVDALYGVPQRPEFHPEVDTGVYTGLVVDMAAKLAPGDSRIGFAALVHECLDGLREIFQTSRGHVVLYPGSGTGAWEAAIVNTLSPGDRVLACVNGHFAAGFARTAAAYGIEVDRVEVAYGESVPAPEVERCLTADAGHEIRAVLVVHNETSTGVTSDVAAVRAAMDRAGHPALLLVDTVSSLASIDFRHDEWGVDVTLTGPQKGLMLPPGLAILAVSDKALDASEKAKCPRSYWDWQPVLDRNARGEFPYTPATLLLFGLREALTMLEEEGLDRVFARHARLAEACRRAVRALGLEILCREPKEYSNTLTATSQLQFPLAYV